MSDIVEFLTRMLDRDQRDAEECAAVYPPPWEMSDRGWMAKVRADAPGWRIVTELEDQRAVGDGGWLGDPLWHIARHDPARVLAEVAAKRAVVGVHRSRADLDRGGDAKICTSCADGSEIAYGDAITAWTAWPCVTLRALASVYRGEDGWDESWALTEVGA